MAVFHRGSCSKALKMLFEHIDRVASVQPSPLICQVARNECPSSLEVWHMSSTQAYLPIILPTIHDDELSRENRIEMIIQSLKLDCSREQIAAALRSLGDGYVRLTNKSRADLPASDEDLRLVESLARRGFVGKYRPEGKRIVAYRKGSFPV